MTRSKHNSVNTGTSPWLIGGVQDLSLIIATPLLILPAMMLARGQWADGAIILFIAAFGQLGHNLPGMMRAYGDRSLFERYKTRFIVAPILLVGVCIFGVVYHLHGLILVTAMWAIWHALMQTHGFVRIYDAKAKSFDSTTRWIDFAMTFTWFGGAIVLSDRPSMLLLTHFYNSGGPSIPAWCLSAVRWLWLFTMTVASIAFVVNSARCWWREGRFNLVKHLLLTTSIGFYWYAYSGTQNILVGAAMFEVFHDIQYLTIVWVFNRTRAKSASGAGAFTRFVFGRSGALIGVYLGLIVAFGSMRYVEEYLTAGFVRNLLTGVIATMGLLHYYYDGFIWKVRDGQVRETLGLRDSGAAIRLLNPTWIRHSAKWALFAMPLVCLCLLQVYGESSQAHRSTALALTFPRDSNLLFQDGRRLEDSGELVAAANRYRTALILDPRHAAAHLRLGVVSRERGRLAISCHHLEQAVMLETADVTSRIQLSRTLAAKNDLGEAEVQLRRAINLEPGSAAARTNLGIVLAVSGESEAAEAELRKALELNPRSADIHFNLGNVLLDQSRPSEAAASFQRALEMNPRLAEAALRLEELRMRSPAS